MVCSTCYGIGLIGHTVAETYCPTVVCSNCKGSGMENNKYVSIVAFVGKMKSGKTTAGKYLVDKYGYTRLRFADRLKKMLREGLGIDERYVDGDLKDEPCHELCGQKFRHGMVTLGTEWGRNMIHPEIWVRALSRDMNSHIAHGCLRFVIDDVRFLSESNWLESLRESVYPSVRVCLIKLIREYGIDRSSTHQSEVEQEYIKTDWTIANEGTLETLYNSVDDVVSISFNKEK